MYKNFSIRTKILLGFLTTLVLMFIIVVVSILELSTIDEQVNLYSEKTIPNVTSVWSMRRDIISSQRYVLRGICESDPATIEDSLAKADEDAQNIRTVLAEYLKTARADESQIAALQDAIATAGNARDKMIPLIKANTSEGDAQALDIYENEYKPSADKAADVAKEIYVGQMQRADEQAETADRIKTGSTVVTLILSAIAIVATIIVTVITTSAITNPLKDVEDTVSKMAMGDFSGEIKYISEDELGQLAANSKKMETTIKTIINDLGEILSCLSRGDFTCKSTCEDVYIGAYKPLLDDTYSLIGSLSSTLSQINQSADQVANGSEQVSLGAQSLSQGAVEQASSVEELSATISEVSVKIGNTSKNAQHAKELSDESAKSLEISRQKMNEMISAMSDISSSSNEINKIIKTIDDIAFQTNILSLNAAVEAARAGAAGKGFAVVADEVRTLAQKSAEAVQSTTAMIESTIEAVANGTKIVDETAKSIVDVVESTKKVVDVIDSIADDASEESDAIAQITVGVDQISSVVQTNSATSEESAAASEELSGQADGLKNLISSFTLSNR